MEKSKSAHTRKALSLALLSTVASAKQQCSIQVHVLSLAGLAPLRRLKAETFELPYAFNIVQKWNSCLLTRTQLHSVLPTLQKVFAYKSTSAFNIASSPTLQTRKTVTCLGRHQITIQLFAKHATFRKDHWQTEPNWMLSQWKIQLTRHTLSNSVRKRSVCSVDTP